jgi:phage host-nuclease inhibitor protein Gam
MKKFKFVLSFIAIFALVGIIVGCTTTAQAEDSYVTLDINPSVELIVSPRDKVIYANPLNEDAEVLLVDLDLVGMDLEDAIDLIIETSIELGYIAADEDTETYVSVSAINADAQIQERIQNRVKEHVNNAFQNKGLMGKAQDKGYQPEFIEEAEGYGVTPGFLFLAKEAVELSDGLLLEDALLMTRAELIEIVKAAREVMKDVAFELRDQFHADRDALIAEYVPQIQALETEIANVEAQIEALEEGADATELEATIADLNEQLEALKTEFHDEMAAVRDVFDTQSEALREEFRQAKTQRRNQFQNEVNQFRQDMEDRRDQMRDRIRDYQDEEDDTEETE